MASAICMFAKVHSWIPGWDGWQFWNPIDSSTLGTIGTKEEALIEGNGQRKRADDERRPSVAFFLRPFAARHGAAARLAQIKRATALAYDDPGQRKMMVPQPEKRPEAF